MRNCRTSGLWCCCHMVSLCSNQGTADKIASYQDIGDQRCVTLVTNQKQLRSLFFLPKNCFLRLKMLLSLQDAVAKKLTRLSAKQLYAGANPACVS